MDQEQHNSAPYEFDATQNGGARWRTIAVIAAAVVVAGGLIAGAAVALTQPNRDSDNHNGAPLGPAPSYSLQPVETGEASQSDKEHIIAPPVVPVKPNSNTRPSKLPKPAFGNAPHFGGHDDDDNEHEGHDD
jgi:hypothetical protein